VHSVISSSKGIVTFSYSNLIEQFLVCLKSKINMFYRLIKRAQNVPLCGFSMCVCNVVFLH
jgi:hypothetical protein